MLNELATKRAYVACSYTKRNKNKQKVFGSGGIRTHAIEMTGALNQRLRPLGHATIYTYNNPYNVHLNLSATSNLPAFIEGCGKSAQKILKAIWTCAIIGGSTIFYDLTLASAGDSRASYDLRDKLFQVFLYLFFSPRRLTRFSWQFVKNLS